MNLRETVRLLFILENCESDSTEIKNKHDEKGNEQNCWEKTEMTTTAITDMIN